MGTREAYKNFTGEYPDNLCPEIILPNQKYIFKVNKNNEEFYYCYYDTDYIIEELKLSFLYGDNYVKVANVIGNSIPLGRLK